MPAPRVYKTAGIVLRHRKLGEADKILILFTPNYGKVDAVAKGVRRPTSKLAGHVEPLTHSSFLLARGRELDIVTQAETLEPLTPLREDLERVGRALYVAELVDRFTADRQESYSLFRLLLETLRRLATHDDLDLVLRYFEMQPLQETGYRPHACPAGPRSGLRPTSGAPQPAVSSVRTARPASRWRGRSPWALSRCCACSSEAAWPTRPAFASRKRWPRSWSDTCGSTSVTCWSATCAPSASSTPSGARRHRAYDGRRAGLAEAGARCIMSLSNTMEVA